MECGVNVPLCGVLTLESGLGPHRYAHDTPVVHGLWPETGRYGSSKCLKPDDASDPTVVHSCYDQRGEAQADLIAFETHEWEKHGMCAGVRDEQDFFSQVCSLSSDPLAVLAKQRASGSSFDEMADALSSAGYEVFDTDSTNKQVSLSACAGSDGQWRLAKLAEFSSVCSVSSAGASS